METYDYKFCTSQQIYVKVRRMLSSPSKSQESIWKRQVPRQCVTQKFGKLQVLTAAQSRKVFFQVPRWKCMI